MPLRGVGRRGLSLLIVVIGGSVGPLAAAQAPREDAGPAADFAALAGRDDPSGIPPVPAVVPGGPPAEWGLADTVLDSLFGDAYAEGRWRPLGVDHFLGEGWLEPWAVGPAGRDGLTPRHGWLGAIEGLFYRLALTSYSNSHNLGRPYAGNGDLGQQVVFLPLSRRFEFLFLVPYIVTNGTPDPRLGSRRDFGDLIVSSRILLSESAATTQLFTVETRVPTGQKGTGGHTMAITPRYEFWTNPGGPWVVRGVGGFFVPLNKNDTPGVVSGIGGGPLGDSKSVAETSFVGGLAAGRYFRPHDVPFGDLVFYAASNLVVPLDGGASKTYLGVGPGTRFHLGHNYFLLHYWEFPVAGARPYDFQMQIGLMKVF